MQELDIGMVGLAVMGRSLALNMADHGFLVGGYNRSGSVTKEMVRQRPHDKFFPFYDLGGLVRSLKRPRKVMLMIKAGKAVDAVIGQLVPMLEQGDIILDGGNSYFEDTRRRSREMAEKGIHYFGVGISGGEKGARTGPSIMPGGEREAYGEIAPILKAIAASAKGEPCCTFIGPDGAGHYVKMVHNGIEYADMQLIAEAYLLLKNAGGFTNRELAETFAQWQEGELSSYLIGITADIFREADDLGEGELLDHILDSAGQKGTGRWTSIEALKQGVDVSMITAACNARVMSNRTVERRQALTILPGPSKGPAINMTKDGKEKFALDVQKGLYAAKIIAYAQGFSLMADAAKSYGWDLDYAAIAAIFRAGCIIQAEFLNEITGAFRKNPELTHLLFDGFFCGKVAENQDSLRRLVATAVQNGVPAPAMSNAAAYLDSFRGVPAGANLVQAQRDCFGAHTYQRNDREGTFHHDWGKRDE